MVHDPKYPRALHPSQPRKFDLRMPESAGISPFPCA